ncbi:hypothetical protein ABW19_dt0208071 [Dactylella cylindrospora]|nr:hypothetical protein ABW19_dt0208071 [Dactylella cylindrospora]
MSNFRTNESPMDWQWDKEGGPSDPSSPFAPQNIQRQLARQAEGGPPRKRHFGEVAVTPVKDRMFAFGAPSSKPVFFTPFQNPLDTPAFKTPRDVKSPSVNSEAEDSPAPNVAGMDSGMATTPDVTPTKATTTTPATKSKKGYDGIFSNLGFSPSKRSGRGELFRPHKYSDKAAKRVTKRRQRKGSNADYWTNSGDSYDSDSDDPFKPNDYKSSAPPAPRWADTHRGVPQILSQYVQLGFNIFMTCLVAFLVFVFVRTIFRDVQRKVQVYAAEAQIEVQECHRKWLTNRCDPESIVPAIEQQCKEWRICADREPESIGWSKVSAETLAEVLDGFVERVSYKSMVFVLVLIFGCVFLTNFAFGFFRAKTEGHPAPILAAAAPRFVDLGGGSTGIMHPYPVFATPSRADRRGRSRSPTKVNRTPFVTARKAMQVEDYDEDDSEMSPIAARKRLMW